MGALVAGMSLLLSACYTQMARDHQAASPETRPWFCNAVGDGTALGGHGSGDHGDGNHIHEIYQGMTKGPLSWEECQQLANQFDALHAAVKDLDTRADAEAQGYRQVVQYIPGLGTHHARFGFGGNPGAGGGTPPPGGVAFDVTSPAFLLYGGEGPEAPLVGVSYAWPGPGNPPEAFAGSNDWWHLHEKVCMAPNGDALAGAEQIPDEECAALGGTQMELPGGRWLLHVWTIPNYEVRPDVFSAGHPCLGETGPLPWEDPCWETTRRDPSEGLPPGTGHDHHDPEPHSDHDS